MPLVDLQEPAVVFAGEVQEIERRFLSAAIHYLVNFDMVRKHVALPPDVHSNIFGAVARSCLQAGLTLSAGFVRSRRPIAHGAMLTQWVIGDRSKVNAWLEAHPNRTPPLGSQLRLFKREECDERSR